MGGEPILCVISEQDNLSMCAPVRHYMFLKTFFAGKVEVRGTSPPPPFSLSNETTT